MKKESIISVVLLVALGMAIYANSLANGFVWDDKYTVVDNTLIKDWSNIRYLFSSDYFRLSAENSYRPLATLRYFINYSFWGLNPAGYHLSNILLHILNGILLYFLLLTLIDPPARLLIALPAALFFISHPVQGEAVNTISYGEELLSTLFFLLSLLLYLRLPPAGKRAKMLLAASLLSFFAALLAKEMAATLPLILILLDKVKGRKLNVRIHLLYWLTLAVYLGVYFVWMRNPRPYPAPYLGGSFLVGLFTMYRVIIYYCRLLIWPVGLCADYLVYPAHGYLPLILLLTAVIIVLISYRYSRIFFLAGMWFFIALLPVANIVPLINFMAERYLYLPSIGFCLLAAWAISGLARIKKLYLYSLSPVLFGGLVIFYSLQTAIRNPQWLNELTYYRAIVECSPSARAHNGLGLAYRARGEIDRAIAEYQKAITLDPTCGRAHNNLGIEYFNQGRFKEAIREYREALKGEPDTSDIHFNLAQAYAVSGSLEDAVFEYREAIRCRPQDEMAHFGLGLIYALDPEQSEKAQKEFQEVLRIDPSNADAYNELGVLRVRKGDYRQAVGFWEKALEFNPGHQGARANLRKLQAMTD